MEFTNYKCLYQVICYYILPHMLFHRRNLEISIAGPTMVLEQGPPWAPLLLHPPDYSYWGLASLVGVSHRHKALTTGNSWLKW